MLHGCCASLPLTSDDSDAGSSGEGSPLPPMAGAVAAAARELVHATFQSSRTCFAFAQLLDRSSLKGFEQWFSWRARSDVANAVTMAHYLSARGAVVTALSATSTRVRAAALERRRWGCAVPIRHGYSRRCARARERVRGRALLHFGGLRPRPLIA